jgi:hypothetical protein
LVAIALENEPKNVPDLLVVLYHNYGSADCWESHSTYGQSKSAAVATKATTIAMTAIAMSICTPNSAADKITERSD